MQYLSLAVNIFVLIVMMVANSFGFETESDSEIGL